MIALISLAFAEPPNQFVDLKLYIEDIHFDIRYSTPHNFTQKALPGYEVEGAWLHKKAAIALKKVQKQLRANDLSLIVYDAYRPVRASVTMYEWAKQQKRLDLFKNGYIARYSGHNHGHSIDVGLMDQQKQEALDMGVPFDTFSTKAHTQNATGTALKNRLLLKKNMESCGFKNYKKEWWHYTYPVGQTKPYDVPYEAAIKNQK